MFLAPAAASSLTAAAPAAAASGPPGWLVMLAGTIASAIAQKAMGGQEGMSAAPPTPMPPEQPPLDFNALVQSQQDLPKLQLQNRLPKSIY